ncbi:MAG: hypothetical protein GY913_00870 [Proteobacteria bacterium]|nr:hypothetical protein [Pseudomonadota bacterium]MCP4915449.1 hypothetical protein [Pseudomonadota bacterium]
MEWARLKSSSLVWLLLGGLVPVLFLLDWAVQSSGSREVWLDAQLQVGLDGQDSLLLAAPLEGDVDEGRLEVSGAGLLREGRYPWRPTPFEGAFTLRIDNDFLTHPDEGNFGASFRIRQVDRADGLGTPPIPCTGDLSVRALRLARDSDDLTGVEAAELDLDLICTSVGPDLLWNSGDERVWMISGPLSLKVGGRPIAGGPTP